MMYDLVDNVTSSIIAVHKFSPSKRSQHPHLEGKFVHCGFSPLTGTGGHVTTRLNTLMAASAEQLRIFHRLLQKPEGCSKSISPLLPGRQEPELTSKTFPGSVAKSWLHIGQGVNMVLASCSHKRPPAESRVDCADPWIDRKTG